MSNAAAGQRILLVEDNQSDAELILHALERKGLAASTHVVHDGAEAVDYLLSASAHAGLDGFQRPALILLDLKMPKVSGIEVLRRIREDPRTRLAPVVALTSSREQRDLVACHDLRINSYVVKPVEYEQFCLAIETIVAYWLEVNQPPPPGPHRAAAPEA